VTLISSPGRGSPEEGDGVPQQFQLLPLLADFVRTRLLSNFEWLFVAATFFGIAASLWLAHEKLAFLNFYFIPVLLAGYFLNTRSAVIGALLSILVVSFFAVMSPDSFYQELSRMGLWLHLVTWGSFLILTGAIVGGIADKLRGRFLKASETLMRIEAANERLTRSYKRLEEHNLGIEAEKARIEAVLNSTMDPGVARLIIAQKVANERRELSALSAGIVELAERSRGQPAGEVVAGLNRLYAAVEPLLLHYKAHLDRYTGDGLLAEFGIPYPLKRHAVLAALAAFRIQQRASSENLPWKLKVGVASGDCVIGLIGSGGRRNYTAVGTAVETAQRLRALCPPGGVAVEEAVAEAVRRWFQLRPLQTQAAVRLSFSEGTARKVSAETGAPGAVYELIGMKDPLDDPDRIPAAAAARYADLAKKVALPLQAVSLIEALEGGLGHSRAVSSLAAALGDAAGLDERQVRGLFLAASMHDVGKCGLPDELVGEGDRLEEFSAEQAELYRTHPVLAEKVIEQTGVPCSPEIFGIIRQHHERFDGAGFPEGLKGDAINLGARILQLCDAYERLTGGLGERDPVEPSEALAEIRRGMGAGRFDPKLGEVFLKLF